MVEWKKLLKRSKSRCASDSHAILDYEDSTRNVQIEESVFTSASASFPNDDPLPDDVNTYYYPDMDMDSARRALRSRPTGTFLLRPSQCPNAKYTLSVKTDKHVFNVRIFKRPDSQDAGFHLDAPVHMRKYFASITELLRHYSQSPKELIALCSGQGLDETTTFKLQYPLSKSEGALELNMNRIGNSIDTPTTRPVTRQVNGGSLKAMVKWL